MSAPVSDESTTTGQSSGQAPAPSTPDVAALQARLEKLEAEKTKLIAENVAKKQREKEALEASAKLAAEQGDYKAQLEIERKRREELEALEPHARRWQEHETAELARLAEVRASLPEAQQKALDAVQGIDAKRAVLEAFGVAHASRTSKPAAPGGAPPAPGLRVDFAEAIKDSAKWAEVKARDPEGAKAYILANGGFSRQASFVRPPIKAS